jgi:rod shape determining protein RodA
MRNSFLEKVRHYFRTTDKMLLMAVIACSVVSCVMLYSIAKNQLVDRCDMNTFHTQLVASLIGLLICLVLSVLDYRKYIRLWMVYAPLALGLTLLTFTGLGYRRSGADDRAWLQIGSFYLQPSELLKLAFILTFSYHLAKDEENMNHPLHFLLLCIHGMIPIGMIALQGDYGTAIVFAFIFLAEMFSAKIAFRYILLGILAIPASCILAWNFLLQDTHKKRILVLLHPGSDPDLEYQQNKGLSALANGNTFGAGLFGGDYVSIPEMHNDFVYAHIGQVWGIIGSLGVLFLLVFICLKVLINSLNSLHRQGAFICVGTFAMLFAHCFMNIGMVLKVMPVIGIPLPFLSAGGTAVVCMYTAIGIVNSTRCHNTIHNRIFYDPDAE